MHTTMYPIETIFWYIIRCGQNNSFFPSKITNFGCYEFCSVTNLQIWRAGVHPTLCNVFILQSKPSRKIETAKRHLLELSWPLQRLRPKLYFFRNKTFLIFKRESWNFQHLFEKEFRETSQNFNSFSSFRQFLFPFFLSFVWWSWNFVRFDS